MESERAKGVGAGTKRLADFAHDALVPDAPTQEAIAELKRLASGDLPTTFSDAAKRALDIGMGVVRALPRL